MQAPEITTVIDVDSSTFELQVLQESHHRPVLVDFWAPWCGPCRALGPTLESLAQEAGGAFLLAKLNTDENQELAGQFRIRGIPAVKAFVDGEVVDEFTGALPENAIRQFLQKLIPNEGEVLARQAREAMDSGNVDEAEKLAEAALKTQANTYAAVIIRAEIATLRGELDEAEQLLEQVSRIPDVADDYERARARLGLSSRLRACDIVLTQPLPTRESLADATADAALDGAALHALNASFETAGALVLDVLLAHRKTHKEVAHQLMLSIIRLAPDEMARDLRRRLSTSLY